MKPTTLAFAALLPESLPLLAADEPGRPHLLGLSHIALYAHELDRTRAFYRDFLGFAEPDSLTNKAGTRVELMEPRTIDGIPAPSSTAPAPHPAAPPATNSPR